MKIVTVIPLAKGVFKENLTYFTSKEIAPGSIVSVTLRNKKILGLVVHGEDVSDAKIDVKGMKFNLKKVVEVKEHSILRDEFIEAIFETNKYFAGRINDTASYLIPGIIKEEYDKVAKLVEDKIIHKSAAAPQNIQAEKLLFQAPIDDRISFYKTAIRGSFAIKKSIFMVLPTEFDIHSFQESLSKGIENFTFMMHAGIKSKTLLENLEKIISCEHPVLVLCTAPFLAIPRSDIGTIIVEHESTSIYRILSRPYIDLRTFVEIFASKIGAKLILSDTLLRFETIERKEKDNLGEASPLSFRVNFPGGIDIIKAGEKFQVLMEDSVKKIQEAIRNKKNVFIFSLRKGLATYTVCRDCHQTMNCDRCLAPVVLYLSKDGKKRMFVCNRCKRELDPKSICKHCGSWNLMPLGIGTDTVYEAVKLIFPNLDQKKIFKLDKESVKTGTQAKKIVKEFEESNGAILVGTEMAFFYLKEKVQLSVLASFDSLWSIPNFRIGERILQIILSVISKTSKEVIIQTKNGEDPAILAVTSGNMLSFTRSELEDRKKLEYPPFKRFIKVTHLGTKLQAQEAKEFFEEFLKEYSPEIFSSFVKMSKDKYSTNALIKLDTKKWSLPELSLGSSIDENLLSKLSSLPLSFSVHIDPEDLL